MSAFHVFWIAVGMMAGVIVSMVLAYELEGQRAVLPMAAVLFGVVTAAVFAPFIFGG